MKALIVDQEFLRKISPALLTTYLRCRGAEKIGAYREDSGIWRYGDQEFIVPVKNTLSDYPAIIAEALKSLESVEQRSQLAIYNDITNITFDVIRVRNESYDTKNGTLSFAKSVDFVTHTRDMLWAVACSASTHKLHYPSRKPQDAERFMNSVRFGKTEQGSFVLTLLAPVTPDLSIQDTLLDIPEEPPYERMVIPTLDSGLKALNQAAMRTSEDNELKHFTDAAAQGVTTNLCDAITNLYEKLTPDFIEVSIAFSGNRKQALPLSKTSIDSGYIPIIKEAASKIKAFQLETEPDQLIRGLVTHLASAEPSESGEVIIADVMSVKPRRITVWLSGEEYRLAGQAHYDKQLVELSGRVERRGKSLRLQDPSNLDILTTGEENEHG